MRMMIPVALAATLLAGTALAQSSGSAQTMQGGTTAGQGKISQQDVLFLQQAVQSDLAEIAMAEVAEDKAQATPVKQFAERMDEEHDSNLEKLQELAEAHDVDIPDDPDAQQQQMLATLKDTPEQSFDRTYIQMQVQAHQKAIQLYRTQAQGQGPVARFAGQQVPNLEAHLQEAQLIQQQLQPTAATR
ncbi:DUF4142 domain-containing protein [Rhodocista pekingensis]|uniref:DUF4142 domain-containing protein n=1 Tax=Rhodocista pekingensis TaxID=201185 RepID=A0ABW2KSF4_9PROT